MSGYCHGAAQPGTACARAACPGKRRAQQAAHQTLLCGLLSLRRLLLLALCPLMLMRRISLQPTEYGHL